MKLITKSLIGYNHPSQANWSYQIYKFDLIDTKQAYCMSIIAKSTFGGDERLPQQLKNIIIHTKDVHTSTGTPKITGISSMLDVEDKDFIKILTDFIKK